MLDHVAQAVTEICAAQDRAMLHAATQSGIVALGFDSFNLGHQKHCKRQFMIEPTLTSWTAQDLQNYDRDNWYDRDPLLARAASKERPQTWSATDWRGNQHYGDYSEYIVELGIKNGVTAPLSNHRGTLSAICVLSFTPNLHGPKVASAVAVIGQVAMTRAATLGLVEADDNLAKAQALVTLSPQQLEILDWARQGKSNRDIAEISGSSKRAIDYHMSEILRKLGVSGRSQAIAILASK